MSPITTPLGLLTMATAAMAAVPHYGSYRHHHHHSSGGIVPTGSGAPYSFGNSTGIYGATGTGTGTGTGYASATETQTTTIAVTSTLAANGQAYSSSGAVSGTASADTAACSAGTVTATYTNVVTVTVTSGSEASTESSSAASATAVTYKAENHHHSYHHYSSSSSSASASSSSVVAPVSSSTYVAPSSSSAASVESTTATLSAYVPSSTSVYVAPSSSSSAVESSTLSAYVSSSTSAAASSTAASSTSSSAAATSTSATSSSKRGCAYAWDGAASCDAFSTESVSWAYDWEPTINGLTTGMNFVPMLKDSSASRCDEWAADAQSAIDSGSEYLLGFNEPDEASQANLSVDEAVTLWNTHLQPFAGKAKLGAPAVTSNSAAGTGLDYLTSFLAACTDCTFDFVPIHWYGWDATQSGSEQATAFQTHVQQAYEIAQKPIWITEFAPAGDVAVDFLAAVIPWLEDDSNNVARYSYYYASTMVSGTTLNSIGAAYQDTSA